MSTIKSGPDFWSQLIAQNAAKNNPVTTQPVVSPTSQNGSQSSNNVVQPTITNNANGTQNYSYDYSNGGFSTMWKDGQLTSVENGSIGKYQGMGYELDSGQWDALQSGKPQQGYGTLQGLPPGMSEDQYFRENMGMSASDYYMQNSASGQAQNSKVQAESDARIKALEKMLEDANNKNKYDQSQIGAQPNVGGGASGEHTFTPETDGSTPNAPGYTQTQNSTNDSLYKYLNNLWQGGF